MKKLRIAVVGCGGITQHYLKVYRALDWVEVAVCIDANLERAEKAGLFLSSHASCDFTASLRSEIDAVIINTPNHLHREQAVAALEANKHVLLQKPVASSVAEAEAIGEAAKQAEKRGQVCGLYMSYFDQPLVHDLKEMVRAGWFGEVAHIYSRLMHRGGLVLSDQILKGESNWRGSVEQTGGGCFIQLAVHYIHLCQWLMDAKVVRATGITRNLHCPGIEGEDLACAILELGNGTLATLDMAWCTAGEQFSIRGTQGISEYQSNRTLMLNSEVGAFTGRVVNYASTREQVVELLAPDLGDEQNPYNQQRLFLEAVRDGRAAFVPIESGVSDLRVVAAVYEAARTGRTVMVLV